jgi:uncharacterized protein (TIGR03083 family)
MPETMPEKMRVTMSCGPDYRRRMDRPGDAIETVRIDGVAFIDIVANHETSTNVKACPGWTLRDLARHQGEVWNFWGQVVAQDIQDRTRLRDIGADATDQFEGAELVDWLATAHSGLISALTDAGVEREVWTWTGKNQPVSWVRRRMVQETAVHRYDAATAVGESFEIPTAIAADGIDEFLTWFAGRERREGEMKPGGTVHLHCTDTTDADTAGGEWFVSNLKEPNCTFTREHRKGDAAVRGRAHDLLMWLWRRSTDGVEVIGKDFVARRFRAYTDLD